MFSVENLIRKFPTNLMYLLVVPIFVTACAPALIKADAATEVASRSVKNTASQANAMAGDLSSAEKQRWDATIGVVGGTVMRVDAIGQMLGAEHKIAGYRIRLGTEKPIPDELLNELVVLIQSKNGFDDSVQKRCKSGRSVGFLLTHSQSDTVVNQTMSGLVVDFGCNRLTLDDDPDTTAVQTYFFDPSRSAFIKLVKRILPDDEQLKSLVE